MYTSNIVLPSNKVLQAQPTDGKWASPIQKYELVEDDEAWKVTIYLNFLKYVPPVHPPTVEHPLISYRLADQIGLLGPFANIIDGLKNVLEEDRTSLHPEHIRIAAELPSGHAVRVLFAEACVKPYLHHVSPDADLHDRLEFNLQREVDEIDSFAADLVRSSSFDVDVIVRSMLISERDIVSTLR